MYSLLLFILGTIILLSNSKSVSAQYEYSGNLCVGAFPNITFKSYEASYSVDAYVYMFLQKFPVWLTTECRARSRQQACMLSIGNTMPPQYGDYARPYITNGNLTFCQNKCMEYFDTAGACGYFTTNLLDPAIKNQLQYLCLFTTPSCSPGALSTVEEPDPVCPYPIVLPDAESFEADFVRTIEGSACALPCPSIIFTPDNWKNFKMITMSLFTIAFVLSSATFINQSLNFEKNFNIAMFSGGCMFSSFWALLYSYISLYDSDSLVCKGNSGNIEHDPFCVFSGWMLISMTNWISAWTFCIALQLWLAVARGYPKKKLDKFRKYMVAFACFLFGIILIPLGAGQIGHEWTGGTLHFCLYKVTTRPKFWHYIFTYSPVFIFSFALPIILVLDTIRYMIQSVRTRESIRTSLPKLFGNDVRNTEVRSEESIPSPLQGVTIADEANVSAKAVHNSANTSRQKESVWTSYSRILFEFYKTSGTALKFLLFVNMFTFVYVFTNLYALYHVETKQAMIDGIKCLFSKATSDPNAALAVCGWPEIRNVWTTYCLILYSSFSACVPFFVFGVGGKAWRGAAKMYRSLLSGRFGSSQSSRNILTGASSSKEDSKEDTSRSSAVFPKVEFTTHISSTTNTSTIED